MHREIAPITVCGAWAPFFITICVQVLKDLTSKTLRMRGRQGLDLLRRRRSMPPPNSGIPWQRGAGEIVELCLLHLKTSTMQKNYRQLTHYVKLLSWKNCYLQNMMTITWCSGFFLPLFHHQWFGIAHAVISALLNWVVNDICCLYPPNLQYIRNAP